MTIKVTNRLGSVTLGQGGYRLISADGFTAAQYSPHIIKYGLNDGGRFHSSRVPPRKLKMTFRIFGDGSENIREELIGFFSPKLPHALTVSHNGTTRVIDGYVSLFDTSCDSAGRPITAELEIICPDPFFRSPEPVSAGFSQFSPQIAFPLAFSPNGAIAGYFSNSGNSFSVFNTGHESTGFLADIKCIQGDVSGIKLESGSDGSFILFNGTLHEGDRLLISTANGSKFVRVNGTDSLSFISRQSRFFSLDIGENSVTCTCDSDRRCLEVRLTFTPRFLGV